MGGPRILTDAQIDEMAELREQGRTYQQIANHFGTRGITISAGSIQWQCMRVGADLPPERRRPSCRRHEPSFRRNGHVLRPFTADEDERLLEFERAGLPISEIGRRIGRKQNSVRARLMVLARREARAEDAA